MKNVLGVILFSFLSTHVLAANTAAFQSTATYFDTIKNNPQLLAAFLHEMPKGGDLHNHMGGSSMAENMMHYARHDNLCINPNNFSVAHTKCESRFLLQQATHQPNLYNAIIDSWSMHNFQRGKESGHDHFFNAFEKYLPIITAHNTEILQEIVERAGEQKESYLELMSTPDNNASGLLGKKVGMDSDFKSLRHKLLQSGLNEIVNTMSKQLDVDEKTLQQHLYCGTSQAKPGCSVTVRYLYQVLREQPPEAVFAQLLAGFELASKDSRVVGINMVQPEDGKIAMRDYHLHMQMVNFLHQQYPKVHISLHAGELIPGLVSNEGLRFHIREAVNIAHAERIGHGVDIAHEEELNELLNTMAKKHILVEINLTSNEAILEVSGKQHPLLLYMRHHVPVALSTDDEGVLRTNLTEQFKKAIQMYHFNYATIKNFIRNSITYSFLPGKSLWNDDNYQVMKSECASDSFSENVISKMCADYLAQNTKAKQQWQLEKQFFHFENNIMHNQRSQ